MDAETVRRYRDEAMENLERRASAGRQTPAQQHIKALLDQREGRIVGLADALLDGPTMQEILDRARAAREVSLMTALILIQTKGDADAALGIIEEFVDKPSLQPESTEELNCLTISAQAIRQAMGLRENGVPEGGV